MLALNFVQVGQFLRVMKERLGLPDTLAAPVAVAAPGAAAPGAAAAAGAAAPEEKKEEKKEKQTVSIKLVKFDAKDKIKVRIT